MNGITIIEEHLCRAVEIPILIVIGFFVTLLFVGAFAIYILIWKYDLLDKKKKEKNRTDIIICSILLVIIYAALWAVLINAYNDTHIEYTVAIDDSVSFNDFYAKYEIVSVSGDEYRVVEKNNYKE